jgi:predicted nucleic acid-binding protein
LVVASGATLAREHRLTAYDAAYLDLVKRERLSLATLDHDLQNAGRTLGIAVLEV